MEHNPGASGILGGQGDSRWRRLLWLGGGAVLLALLLGAAYTAGGMLVSSGPPGESQVVTNSSPSAGQQTEHVEVSVSLELERASELPQGKADLVGRLSHREGDSLLVETARVTGATSSGQGSQIEYGPPVEIVTTRSTVVYRDVTALKGGGRVQQQVEESSVEDIDVGCTVVTWGERQGDRLVADVIVYRAR